MDDEIILKVIKAIPILAQKFEDRGELFDFNKVGLS